MTRTLRLLGTAMTAVLLSSCVQVYPPGAQPSPSPQSGGAKSASAAADKKDDKDPFKPWDKVLEDTRAVDGYVTAHVKRDNTLYFEIPESKLGRDFGMAMHISRGAGDFNLYDGLYRSETRMLRFERVGDQVYLIHRNPRFTADEGSPMAASLEENVGHSVLAAFKIESQHEESKALLVDVTEFFVSDYGEFAEQLKFYYGNKPVSFDKARSHVGLVQGFAANTEIDAELTYRASDLPRSGGDAVSDYRSVPVGLRYSLFALPEDPMMPRLADDRVGHFLDAIWDFSRDRDTDGGFVRYVNRWRLEKADPSAELSEPIEPIVYYIDRSVPEEYRGYVKTAIEAWNKAYEKAGFRNAIVAKVAPTVEEDPTWSAEDVRYSTVRWTTGRTMSYAIGPSQTDPRTGEILNADILIASNFVRFWAEDWENFSPEGILSELAAGTREPYDLWGHGDERMCMAAAGMQHQLRLGYAALLAQGVIQPGQPMPEDFIAEAVGWVTMHEVGHTLGLRHNFKASAGVPNEKLHDRRFTRENGVVLSVMDYHPANIARDPARQGHYFNPEVGSYDEWVIQYAYAPVYQQTPDAPFAYAGTLAASPEDELVGLRKIADQAASPLHLYGSDEDRLGGGYAVDPLTTAYDLGADPLAWAEERRGVLATIQPTLEDRLLADGEGYQKLRGALSTVLFERYINAQPVTKLVGGLYTTRDHKGQPDARPPFTPVAAERQRQAVSYLVDTFFDEDAFDFSPDLLNKLAPSRWRHWGSDGYTLQVDYPVHEQVAGMQRAVLATLVDRNRLQRMIDNEVRMPRGAPAYRVEDLFDALTGAVWTELGSGPRAARSVDSFRRSLQTRWIDEMTELMLDVRSPTITTPAPGDARALARYHLAGVSGRIERALAAGGSMDVTTRAHLMQGKARIDSALEAAVATETPR